MEEIQKKHFICPMKCEGTKVYDQSGNCPVCKMQLIPVEADNKHGKHGKCCS